MRANSMIASVATALLYLSAANAYSVLAPTNSSGWTVGGPNTFAWTRVDSDPQNFTLVLDNQVSLLSLRFFSHLSFSTTLRPIQLLNLFFPTKQNVFPQYQQVLNALVDGTQNPASITVNPPSGGFVAGTGYRVNVVTDSQHLDSLLVQSDEFTIKAGGSSSSGSVSASSTGSATELTVPPTPSQP